MLLALSVSASSQTKDTFIKAPDLNFSYWLNPNDSLLLKGKPIMLEFWATWCGSCIKAIPHFNELADKYSDEITFLSVNAFDNKDTVMNRLSKLGIQTPVVLDENKVLLKAFNVGTIPSTILIDEGGYIRWRGLTGLLTDELIDTFLIKNAIISPIQNKYNIPETTFYIKSDRDSLPISYTLTLEISDGTEGKTVGFDFENKIYFFTRNVYLKSVFNYIISYSSYDIPEIVYSPEISDDLNINMKLSSPYATNSAVIFDNVLEQFLEEFNYKLQVQKMDSVTQITVYAE